MGHRRTVMAIGMIALLACGSTVAAPSAALDMRINGGFVTGSLSGWTGVPAITMGILGSFAEGSIARVRLVLDGTTGAVTATLFSDNPEASLGNAGALRRFSISGNLGAGVGGGVSLDVASSNGAYPPFQVFVNRSLVQSVDTTLVVSVLSAVPKLGSWAMMLAGLVGVVGMSARRRRS